MGDSIYSCLVEREALQEYLGIMLGSGRFVFTGKSLVSAFLFVPKALGSGQTLCRDIYSRNEEGHYGLVKMVSRHLMGYGVAVELRQAFFPRWGWIFFG